MPTYKFNPNLSLSTDYMGGIELDPTFSSLQDLIDKGTIVEVSSDNVCNWCGNKHYKYLACTAYVDQVKALKEEVKDRWVPKDDEVVFVLNGDGICETNHYSKTNYGSYSEFGSVFPTRELAQAAAEEVKETLIWFHKKHNTAEYEKD